MVDLYQRRVNDGYLRVLVGREPKNGGPEVWHLSISHKVRIPAWYEIKEARYKFLPDGVNMAIMFPPVSQYVDLHPHTIHLWEIPIDLAEKM